MAWDPPSGTVLYAQGELFEFANFSQPITYQNPEGQNFVVQSIVASEDNDTVNVTTDGIEGFFSNTFEGYSIQFLREDDRLVTVRRWEDIVGADEIVSYRPAMTQTKTYTYTATAVGTSLELGTEEITTTAEYTIIVTNSWDVGRTALLKAVAQTVRNKR